MSKRLALIGAGGHARSVMAAMPRGINAAGYVDMSEAEDLHIPYLGDDETFICDFSPAEWDIFITVVSGRDCSLGIRRRLIDLYAGYGSPSIIAPTAWVAESAVVGKGTAVMHHAVVNTDSIVGEHSVVNTGAIIEHDCKVGSNVFIGPGAVLCGGVEVGDNVYIGAGAVVRPGVKIVSDSLISLGASVFRNIRVPGTYFGNPAHKIK